MEVPLGCPGFLAGFGIRRMPNSRAPESSAKGLPAPDGCDAISVMVTNRSRRREGSEIPQHLCGLAAKCGKRAKEPQGQRHPESRQSRDPGLAGFPAEREVHDPAD